MDFQGEWTLFVRVGMFHLHEEEYAKNLLDKFVFWERGSLTCNLAISYVASLRGFLGLQMGRVDWSLHST